MARERMLSANDIFQELRTGKEGCLEGSYGKVDGGYGPMISLFLSWLDEEKHSYFGFDDTEKRPPSFWTYHHKDLADFVKLWEDE